MEAKKSLGQNFFINKHLCQQITNYIIGEEPDVLVEIGPGQGFFTNYLYEKIPNTVLIEKDCTLSKDLSTKFPKSVIKNIDFLDWNYNELDCYKDKKIVFFGSLPYNVSKPIIRKIITSNYFNHSCFFIIQKEVADKYNLGEVKGVLVTRVIDDGSAMDAGLQENDVILAFDGVEVKTVAELQEQVGKHRPGDKVTITYFRNAKEKTIPVVLKNVAGNTNVVTASMNSEEVFGARLSSLSSSDKKAMKVDYGVKITDLNDGRFKDLGLKKGYIILNVNGKKVKSASDVKQFTDNGTSLKSIGGIQSDGTIFSYQFGE